ncbi:MAG: helix-turn-helix transcriptional regulator [Candidatus Riflebacteria bacterium]|nr:helix-turn-helix transcriptional regulator [Candidatus Riflebacteria bacterium]
METSAAHRFTAHAVALPDRRVLPRKIGIAEVARYAGYSRAHLSKIFRQATGQPIVRYLNSLRVDRARERIRAGQATIEEVAHEVGFQNLNHFYKTFKKITGKLPSAYKEGLME